MTKRELTPLEQEILSEDEKEFMEGLEPYLQSMVKYMKRHLRSGRTFRADAISPLVREKVKEIMIEDSQYNFSDLHARSLKKIMKAQKEQVRNHG